ncbi:ABC-2 type transport system permease protein [Actinokineospora alba]|uniref:ABC-2 type transport system permease protein n=1 Tax=Actinokineospora alba TaxID=504798 RepID=A0A1H0S3Y1_9PSEU|nr:ABC transporter permease [Actinokineospora alba]TDP66775.1 ABC-2 type transport system permease protein [Actinokineospora alba]SDI49946.1 ABC-2 type transport system permease protein [Actinokineospora alba]SDP36440.1 ABC-2 type transport system permease protein [Actinokineospora alba]
MNTWSVVGLVAGREVRTKLRSKAFIITTVATLVLLVGFALVMKLASGGSDSTVGLTGGSTSLSAPLKATADSIGQSIETREIHDEAAGRRQVDDGTLDALLVGDGSNVVVVVKKDIDGKLRATLNVLAGQLALNQQIVDLGGDPARVAAEVAGAKAEVRPLEPPFDYNGQQLVLGMIAGVLIYMSLLVNGQAVAQGVVEEKSSRVVELLLATIQPWQLMAGKVLGIGLVGLIQMVVIGGVGVVAGLGLGVLTISVGSAVGTVVWLVVWFLLGFFAYSLVFAALGALVSRQEDVGGVITPPLMFVVLGYVVGISILPSDPGNKLVETLSIVPLFAPTLMPMRLAMGGVPVWQAALSVALVVALIPALVWLSGRIYRNAVMRSGGKVRLRDALKM